MKHYLLILKLLLINALPRKKGAGESGKRVSRVAVLGFVGLFCAYAAMAALICYVVAVLGPTFAVLGVTAEFIAVIFGAAGIVTLLFGVVSLLSYLYFSRDTEFFLSLPVKPSAIFLAKFTVAYIFGSITSTALLLPSLVTFGIVTSAPVHFYFLIPIGIALAPAIPQMLAAALAIPLMYVVGFFRRKGALTSIVLLVVFGVFFGFYFYLVQSANSGEFLSDPLAIALAMQSSMRAMANIVYPYYAFARAAVGADVFGGAFVSVVANLFVFLGSVALSVFIAGLISQYVYKRGAASQLEGYKNKSTGREKYSQSSAFMTLVKKEWRELIRTPAFAYQCLSPIIIAPLFIGIMAFTSVGDALKLSFAGGGVSANADLLRTIVWFIFFLFVMMFAAGFNIAASTAVTREGQNFYLSKQIPVSYAVQIKAKLFVSFAISLVAMLASLIMLTVAFPDLLNLGLSLIFFPIYIYGFICFSIYFDLRKPKLDWAVPNQAMKQNFNAVIPYFINILITIALGAVVFVMFIYIQSFTLALVLVWSVLFVFALAAAVPAHVLLFKNAAALYDRLSV
ncbi:MAG: hypothetical protein LBP26_00685 [Clostridiales bacterium]|jgi:ABC-2 type transport system permease protein|nr:hypothetical protein [Clostridiales bacterium]